MSHRSVEVGEAWGAGGGRAKSRVPRRKRRSAAYPPASFPGSSCTATLWCSDGATSRIATNTDHIHPRVTRSERVKRRRKGQGQRPHQIIVPSRFEKRHQWGEDAIGGGRAKVRAPLRRHRSTGEQTLWTFASSCRRTRICAGLSGGRAMNSDVDVASL